MNDINKLLSFAKGYTKGILIKIKTEIEQCYYNDNNNVDGVIIFKRDIDDIFNEYITEMKEGDKHE